MANYEVEIKAIEIYKVRVDSDSEDEAIEMAQKIFESSDNKYQYHDDSDMEITVTDC